MCIYIYTIFLGEAHGQFDQIHTAWPDEVAFIMSVHIAEAEEQTPGGSHGGLVCPWIRMAGLVLIQHVVSVNNW